jgi:DNA invertase Pin-like site-specific DNA recombinase
MGQTVFYARSSSSTQKSGLEGQLELAKEIGADKVFSELASGAKSDRAQLKACLDYLREGDTLVVHKLDRSARSMGDLYNIISKLDEKGVKFRCLDNDAINTTTKHGKLLLGILGTIAEFERSIIRERQQEGIERYRRKLQAEGKKPGRAPKLTEKQSDSVKSLRAGGESIRAIQDRYRVSRASVYRALAA